MVDINVDAVRYVSYLMLLDLRKTSRSRGAPKVDRDVRSFQPDRYWEFSQAVLSGTIDHCKRYWRRKSNDGWDVTAAELFQLPCDERRVELTSSGRDGYSGR